MVDYIGSDAIKKYYEENGIVLSDRMIAARICNAGFNIGEIHSSLREIQARTEDADLKRQIEEYISMETSMYEEMEKSVPGDIYKLSVWWEGDEEYSEHGYFSDFGLALSMVREIKDKEKDADQYMIEKFHIVDRSQLPFMGECWAMGHADGCAKYDSEGELYAIWVRPEEDRGWERSFADEYFSYPHPFKKGDILVRNGDDEMLYIKDMSPEEEAERDKRVSPWGDVTDSGIIATMISRRTGRIWDMDEWINPLEFEYAHIDEKTEDVVERAALQIQRLLQGRAGSFQYIYDACARRREEYLESDRVSLITGIRLHPHNVD